MLKKLWNIPARKAGWWLAWFIAGISAVIVVVSKDHHATEEYKAACQKRCATASLTPEQQATCQNEIDSPSYYLPWGYKFVAWPEAVTVWALLATLAGILWQAKETSKAAKATAESAAAAFEQIRIMKKKERARLVIALDAIKEIDADLPWEDVTVRVSNVGYSHAFNVRLLARCEITMSNAEPDITDTNSDIIPIVRIDATPEVAMFPVNASAEIWKNVIRPGAKDLCAHFWGSIQYEDVFGDNHPIRFQYFMQIRSLKENPNGSGLIIDAISTSLGWKKCSHPEHNPPEHTPPNPN